MPLHIKSKYDLNKVTHSVRAVQAVMQYGVGAMVDFSDQTLVTAAPEAWGEKERIYDDRLASALHVDFFESPVTIAYSRFPRWYFCPRCRRLQSLAQWEADYRRLTNEKVQQADPHMISHMQCPKCRQDLVVSRIVTICDNGHLNDFPWVEWVHAKCIGGAKPICASPILEFKTGSSASEGLEGLIVNCTNPNCRASTSLKGAFDKDCFEKLDEKENSISFRCPGNHPFRNSKETCNCYPHTVQRGASSVYFPLVYSSLVIPPYADKIGSRIENSQGFNKCVDRIHDYEEDYDADEIHEKIIKRIPKWSQEIGLEIGAPASDVEAILKRKWLVEDEAKTTDITSYKYKLEEYHALNGTAPEPPDRLPGEFSREEMDGSLYGIPHVKSISLIDKIRVVNALVGFSRGKPINRIDDQGYVDIKEHDTRWYPAYEVRGEGIFIEFESKDINKWMEENPAIEERCALLRHNFANSYLGTNHAVDITPKMVMLHTLSHLLIAQLSFECGYNVASLSERLYCFDGDDSMAGILIYTASGDSEGTLGGLVRQGRPDTLPNIFRKALRQATTCSNDPVCIMSKGQGREALNLAACHSCALLPETSCEEKNAFLDRAMLVGTFKDRNVGFWTDYLSDSQ